MTDSIDPLLPVGSPLPTKPVHQGARKRREKATLRKQPKDKHGEEKAEETGRVDRYA